MVHKHAGLGREVLQQSKEYEKYCVYCVKGFFEHSSMGTRRIYSLDLRTKYMKNEDQESEM